MFRFWIIEKRVFLVQKKKFGHNHRIQQVRISVSMKFYLKQIILIFCTKFAQKGDIWSITGHMNIALEFNIFELVWVPNFILNPKKLSFWARFGQIGYFLSKTEKKNIINKFSIFELVYNHFHNNLRLFDVLPNFPFITRETMGDYYL